MIAPSDFLPNFTSQIAACEFLSSSSLVFHRKRTYLWNQFLRGLTDHYFCLSGSPTQSCSSSNSFASVDKLSASAVRITCAQLFPQNSLGSDTSATLNFSLLVQCSFQFSGRQNSLFQLKEPILSKRTLHWYVVTLKSSTYVPGFSQTV